MTFRCRATWILVATLCLPSLARADAASGTNVRLETYSLSAVGASQSGAATRSDSSVGQPVPTGVMQSSSITLEPGFWPTTVPEPGLLLLNLGVLGSLVLLARFRQGGVAVRRAR